MARKLSPAEVVEEAAHCGAIPDSVEASSKGEARWSRDGLSILVRVERRPDGLLGWHAYVGDEKLGPAMKEYGSLSVAIRSVGDPGVPWPTEPGHGLADSFREELSEAGGFVADRADLARVLASEADVCRGTLYAWLPPASLASRLVQAIVIARDLGDEGIEGDAIARLRSGSLVAEYGRDIDILVSARGWAKRYSRALGYKVNL